MRNEGPITTVQFYRGDATAAATFLRQRLVDVARLNPWIGGRLVKTKEPSGLALQFSKENVPIDELFEVIDELFKVDESNDEWKYEKVEIHAGMPYGQLVYKLAKPKNANGKKLIIAVPNGEKLIKKRKPVCKLTVLSCSHPSDSFAVIFSMSHVVGDGHSYYTILNMLSASAELTEMDVSREEKFQEAIPRHIGQKEFQFMMSPPFCMMCHYIGIMSTAKKVTPLCFFLDKEKLAAAKEQAKAENGAAAFVSTNDIVTSGFGRAVQARMLTMTVDFRNKVEGLTAKHAGNYFGGLIWDPDGYGSPNTIRTALTGSPPLSRGTLPTGCCISGNWTAMISNWSSMSKGSLDIPDCQQTLHLPYLNTAEMKVDSCIVFKARPGEVAVMLFLQNATVDAAKAQLPLGEPVSTGMFGPAG